MRSTKKQCELEANTRHWRQEWENACDWAAIGFSFTSGWLRMWREFFIKDFLCLCHKMGLHTNCAYQNVLYICMKIQVNICEHNCFHIKTDCQWSLAIFSKIERSDGAGGSSELLTQF